MLATRGTDSECYECGKHFPRPRVDKGRAVLKEDPQRKGIFRLWLQRNCSLSKAAAREQLQMMTT